MVEPLPAWSSRLEGLRSHPTASGGHGAAKGRQWNGAGKPVPRRSVTGLCVTALAVVEEIASFWASTPITFCAHTVQAEVVASAARHRGTSDVAPP